MKNDNNHIYLAHGSDWPEHEDYLVGNKEGLEALVQAATNAINNGESKTDLYEFVGVRCLENNFFEKNQEESSFLQKLIFWVLIIFSGSVFLVGLKTILGWFGII